MIRFELDEPTPLLNVVLRMHWRKRGQMAARFAWLVRAATSGRRPAVPLPRAKVRIERHSIGTPDYDGMVGGVKQLIDCLLPLSDRHPHGLGFIADDGPACLQLEVVAVRAPNRATQKTVVVIEPLP